MALAKPLTGRSNQRQIGLQIWQARDSTARQAPRYRFRHLILTRVRTRRRRQQATEVESWEASGEVTGNPNRGIQDRRACDACD
jgi:hypothetical protein